MSGGSRPGPLGIFNACLNIDPQFELTEIGRCCLSHDLADLLRDKTIAGKGKGAYRNWRILNRLPKSSSEPWVFVSALPEMRGGKTETILEKDAEGKNTFEAGG